MAKKRIGVPILAAERLSVLYKCPMILVYAIEESGEQFIVTTYGQTKKMCRHAADIGRKFAEAIMNCTVVPADIEPLDVPDEPTILESTDREVKKLIGPFTAGQPLWLLVNGEPALRYYMRPYKNDHILAFDAELSHGVLYEGCTFFSCEAGVVLRMIEDRKARITSDIADLAKLHNQLAKIEASTDKRNPL